MVHACVKRWDISLAGKVPVGNGGPMTTDMDKSSGSAGVTRLAAERDIFAIAAIYGHHVRHGLASFEEIEPSEKRMALRFDTFEAKRCLTSSQLDITRLWVLLARAPIGPALPIVLLLRTRSIFERMLLAMA
jgi:hypothetical protein